MNDSQTYIRTLFRSNLMHVFDYRCAGHDDEGEIPEGYEIVLPRAGAYQRRDSFGTFLADPNQVLFYNKGEPYDISHPVQGGDSSTVFLFAPALLVDMIRAYDPDIEDHTCQLFQRSHITFATRLQILQYRLLCTNNNATEPLAVEEQIVASLSEIIRALHPNYPARQNHLSTNTLRAHAEQTQAVMTFLNAHLRSRLQLEQISSAVHLSPFHLCRIFKQNTCMTLNQYVRRLRLFNAAEQILENPKARLDLLALEYGFSNHGNFSTAFRAAFGINPSEFRSVHLREMSKNLKA
jgi:AraC family transcriptional regulator